MPLRAEASSISFIHDAVPIHLSETILKNGKQHKINDQAMFLGPGRSLCGQR
jgi:hypothetical protein